jgi:hypothetical protein
MSEWANTIVEQCRIGASNIFVLGCLERKRISVSAQQVRAINIIEALRLTGILQKNISLCIVGAGAGGITAAAYAGLLKAKVTIIDQNEKPMHQLTSSKRLLHPRLYEWPFEENWAKEDVDLPLMNWSASAAKDVVKRIYKEWDEALNLYEIIWKPFTTVEKVGVDCSVLARKDGQQEFLRFDAIVLAPGFGKERIPPNGKQQSYWDNDDLESYKGEVLVCGNGDGALTDILRVRLRDFNQESIVSWLDEYVDKDLEILVRDAENSFTSSWSKLSSEGRNGGMGRHLLKQLYRAYCELETDDLRGFLQNQLRPDTSVRMWIKLNVDPSESKDNFVFSPNSFPLNRLLITTLLRVDTKEHFSIDIGADDCPQPDHPKLIYRAGTEEVSPIKSLGLPIQELKELEKKNLDASTGDRTRHPLWAAGQRGKPTTSAFVLQPRGKTSSQQGVAEVFNDLKEWIVFSDLLDSLTQSLLSDSGEDVIGQYRALLRLYSVLYDEIWIGDAQFFDGRFFLDLAEHFDVAEWDYFKGKLRLVSRSGDYDPKIGFLKAAGFRFGGMDLEARNSFDIWLENYQGKLLPYNKPKDVLRMFTTDCPKYLVDVERICKAWDFWDELLQHNQTQPKLIKQKPSPFQIDIHFENPAAFIANLKDEWAKDLARTVWTNREKRSLVEYKYLAPARENKVTSKIAYDISGWYHRAYNRTIARKEGPNIYDSIHVGPSPIEPEAVTKQENCGLDMSPLAKMTMKEYLLFSREISPTLEKYRRTGELGYKIEALSKIPADKRQGTPAAADPIVRRLLNSIRPYTLSMLYIGSREAGPQNTACVTEQATSNSGEPNATTEVVV